MTYDPTMRSKPHIERREREARRRRDMFEKIFEGADIAKAGDRHDVGAKGLASATAELAIDLIRHHRRRLGLVAKGGGQPEESNMRTTSETLESIMKDGGIAGVCAAVVSKGSTTISEHELVEAVSKVAAERYPELSSAQAFAKIYSDGGEEGRVLRSAINVAKLSVFDLAPVYVGGPDAMHEAIDATEQSEAYAQLEAMASKLRASSPWLSAEQAFAKVFEDPKNGKLAAKAHRRPSPTTSYEWPR
jgi:hypothetical protein